MALQGLRARRLVNHVVQLQLHATIFTMVATWNVYVLVALPLMNVSSTRLATVVSTATVAVSTPVTGATAFLACVHPPMTDPVAPTVSIVTSPQKAEGTAVVPTLPVKLAAMFPVSVVGPTRTRSVGVAVFVPACEQNALIRNVVPAWSSLAAAA